LNDINTEKISTEEETPNIPGWQVAVWAAEDRKATNIRVLDLTEVTTFADTFVICTASNARQAQAITDAIQQALKQQGEQALSIEGFEQGEWILSDYADLIVHVFSEKAREFYDLDRLWRQAKVLDIPPNPNARDDRPFSMSPGSPQASPSHVNPPQANPAQAGPDTSAEE
jgi:ribosome-associated protein